MDYLEECSTKYPDLQSSYNTFSDLFNQKLWHELTLELLSFVNNPKNKREGNLNFVSLYDSFLTLFDGKLNQLSLAKIVMKVAESYTTDDLQVSFQSEATKHDVYSVLILPANPVNSFLTPTC